MSVDLSPVVLNEIKRQVGTGVFANPDEVLREALAALRDRECAVLAIQGGIDDMEAGRVRPIREFDRDFRSRNGLPAAE
jgi:Arc/MetJ-type ribon-helix-helix transcriptional regulator